MTLTNATQTVTEMATHICERLQGIPGVSDNVVQTLVRSWIRSEQSVRGGLAFD